MKAERNMQGDMETILQNLRDADCSSEIVADFMAKRDAGNVEAQLRILAAWRVELLEKIHQNQRFLDCLDFLVYQLRKEVYNG